MALEAGIEICDGILGRLLRSELRHPVDRPFGQHQFHDGLAPASKRGGCAAVVGVAAAANDRRVADSPRCLVQGAPGGGGCGQVPGRIQRHRAHGVVGVGRPAVEGRIGNARAGPRLGRPKALPFPIEHQLGVID